MNNAQCTEPVQAFCLREHQPKTPSDKPLTLLFAAIGHAVRPACIPAGISLRSNFIAQQFHSSFFIISLYYSKILTSYKG